MIIIITFASCDSQDDTIVAPPQAQLSFTEVWQTPTSPNLLTQGIVNFQIVLG